jgi:hypothetical protein
MFLVAVLFCSYIYSIYRRPWRCVVASLLLEQTLVTANKGRDYQSSVCDNLQIVVIPLLVHQAHCRASWSRDYLSPHFLRVNSFMITFQLT